MEKRQSERVQFFQVPLEKEVVPVWVFRRSHPNALLGLLLNISLAGVQLLTDKAHALDDGSHRLTVYTDDRSQDIFLSAQVRHLWSKTDGEIYSRHGFFFTDEKVLAPAIAKVMAAREIGMQWLRCELARV
ncbi:MAG: PilZ domain-containing protein [Pseudomonadota bacterium]